MVSKVWMLACGGVLALALVGCGSSNEAVQDVSDGAGSASASSDTRGETGELSFFVYPEQVEGLLQQGAALLDTRHVMNFRTGHIPGAAHAPWQDFVEGSSNGLVTDDLRKLEETLRAAGVRNDKPVIVYGSWLDGWGEEGRIFWMLEYLGHRDVHILYGGLDRWKEAGGETQLLGSDLVRGNFTATLRPELRASADEVKEGIDEGSVVILDTRRPEEYGGETPYGSARGGHVPGARHFYWKDVFQENGELQAPDALKARLRDVGVGHDTIVIAYCTGGVRSGFMYTIMRWLGYESPRNYDGSWWEWSGNDQFPVEK